MSSRLPEGDSTPAEDAMPELPEVEVMTRLLHREAAGRVLQRIELLDPSVLHGDPGRVAGLRVDGAWRRAKLSILDLGEWALVLHFRMTGKVLRQEPSAPAPKGTRLRLWLEGPVCLGLVDLRRLAQAWVLPRSELDAFLLARRLGPEPWPERREGSWWRSHLCGRGAIKTALLDQGRVAGLGNILASEALWRARIDPRASAATLSPASWEALARAVPETIDETIALEEGRLLQQGEIHYVNQGGPNPFQVYGRTGLPCPRCGHPIARVTQGSRGTWWCSICQTPSN